MAGSVAGAALAPVLRAGTGIFCQGYSASLVPNDDAQYAVTRVGGRMVLETSTVASLPRPTLPLQLYEFEGCPFCRKVREAINILDLDVLMYPAPQGGTVYRPEAIEKGGKKMFPYLVDPNTDQAMYESDDIIAYLFDTYGGGRENVPLALRMGAVTALTAGLAMLPRMGKGSRAVEGRAQPPAEPLVYYGYEPSPFCKVVRESLNELELPHLWVTTARGSPARQALYERLGRVTLSFPYLEDPNTGVKMFESADIVEYLNETYGPDRKTGKKVMEEVVVEGEAIASGNVE